MRSILACLILRLSLAETKTTKKPNIFFSVAETKKTKKPNVLVILADDLGTGDIPGYYENACKVTGMKNIEDLVSKGIVFTDAHSTPFCAPSRYSFLSGNYQSKGAGSNNGTTTAVVWEISDSPQFKPGQKSIANVFSDAGYNTAMMGKWHVGGKIPPNGLKSIDHYLTHPDHDWTIPFIGGPQDIGFNSSLITPAGIQKYPYSWFRDGILQTDKSNVKWWDKGEYEMPEGTSKIEKNGEGDINWDSTAYNMILVDEMIRFLDDHVANAPDKPFFTYFAMGNVHTPHSPPKQYIDGTPVDKTQHTAHMDMIFELDLVLGSLIEALEDKNLLKDTIIVFTSDNGGLPDIHSGALEFDHFSNGILRGSKGQLFEGGHRVPMIMRYDRGLPSGETRDNLFGINDLFATLCEMADIPIPDRQAQDSISFAKYAYDKNNNQNLREHFGIWASSPLDVTKGCAIRSADYKLIYRLNRNADKWISILYNLKNDPMETRNLSHPSYSKIRKELLKKLLSLGPCCHGDVCLY